MKKHPRKTDNIRDYKKDPPVLNITKATLERLKQEDKKSDLLALYVWYGYVTIWQDTRTIWAGVNYMSEITGWSPNKVKRIRKRLLEIGLIEDVQQRKENGDFGKCYIRVHYFCAGHKTRRAQDGSPMCLVNNKDMRLNNNLRGGRKTVPHMRDENSLLGKDNTFITRYSQKLHTTLKLRSQFRDVKVETYGKAIYRLLHTEHIDKDRLKRVFKYYITQGRHSTYCPVIYKVSDLVEKFLRIEDAMNRYEETTRKRRQESGEFVRNVKKRRLADGSEEVTLDYDTFPEEEPFDA